MTSAEPHPGSRSVPATNGSRWTSIIGVLLMCGLSVGALVGALVSSMWTMLVVAPAVGALVAGLVALEKLDFPADPTARRAVLFAGCGGALLVPLVEGILWLGALGVPMLLVGLGVGALAGVLVDPEPRRPGGAAPPRSGGSVDLSGGGGPGSTVPAR